MSLNDSYAKARYQRNPKKDPLDKLGMPISVAKALLHPGMHEEIQSKNLLLEEKAAKNAEMSIKLQKLENRNALILKHTKRMAKCVASFPDISGWPEYVEEMHNELPETNG